MEVMTQRYGKEREGKSACGYYPLSSPAAGPCPWLIKFTRGS